MSSLVVANVLPTATRVAIVNALVEGCSIRTTARMVRVSKDTVLKLQRELGEACTQYMDEAMQDLPWKTEDLVALLPEPEPTKRGPYAKRDSN